jgi:hypothetical protein
MINHLDQILDCFFLVRIVTSSILDNYFYIRIFKQNSKAILERNSVEIFDVEKNVDHVLIHYLYFETYQTLDNMKISSIKKINIEFKRSFLIYTTTKIYELAELQQLAMHKIEQHNMKINIFDVLEAFNEEISQNFKTITIDCRII